MRYGKDGPGFLDARHKHTRFANITTQRTKPNSDAPQGQARA